MKTIQKWGEGRHVMGQPDQRRDGSTGSTTFWLSLKKYGEFGRGNKFSLNAPTVFRNIWKMYLVCRENGTFQTSYQLWSTVRFSWQHPIEPAPPISHLGTCWTALRVCVLWAFAREKRLLASPCKLIHLAYLGVIHDPPFSFQLSRYIIL